MRTVGICIVGLAWCACSSPAGTIDVTLGGETDTLTRGPAVASLDVEAVERNGTHHAILTATLPITTLDLGDLSQTLVASIQLTGKDSSGNAVVFGATPYIELGAISGGDIPLFIQRKGTLARMPGALSDSRSTPLVTTLHRGIYMAGGGQTTLVGYDLLYLSDFGASCATPSDATSFAFVQLAQTNEDGDLAVAYAIDSTGMTRVGGVTCSNFTNFLLPTGTTWPDIAGGATVNGDDGSAYVVGPSTVLKLDTSEAFDVFGPFESRQGPAVAWAPGRGIFVYGGGKGAVIISATGALSSFTYPDEPTPSLAAIAFDANKTMLVAGDMASPRTIDLTCSSACTPTPWGEALPFALLTSSLFSVGTMTFLLVGDDVAGTTHVFLLDASKTTELKLNIARSGARAVQTETGEVIIMGGGNATPESFWL